MVKSWIIYLFKFTVTCGKKNTGKLVVYRMSTTWFSQSESTILHGTTRQSVPVNQAREFFRWRLSQRSLLLLLPPPPTPFLCDFFSSRVAVEPPRSSSFPRSNSHGHLSPGITSHRRRWRRPRTRAMNYDRSRVGWGWGVEWTGGGAVGPRQMRLIYGHRTASISKNGFIIRGATACRKIGDQWKSMCVCMWER